MSIVLMLVTALVAALLVAVLASAFVSPRMASRFASARADALAALLVGTAILSACLLTASASMNTIDFQSNYLLTQAMVEHGTIYQPPGPPSSLFQGRWISQFGLGLPVLSSPLYAAAMLLSQALDPAADPGRYTRFAVMLTNSFVTSATGALLYLLCRRLGFGRPVSAAIPILWVVTTPAWVYADTLFGEPVVALCLVAATLGLLEYEERSGADRFAALALASFALGYSAFTRVSSSVVIPLFLGYVVYAAMSHPEGSIIRALIGRIIPDAPRRPVSGSGDAPTSLVLALGSLGLPLGIWSAAVLWYNHARFGNPLNFGYAGFGFSSSLVEGAYGLLLSPGKGLVEYAPLVLLGVYGWITLLRARPAVALLFAGSFGVILGQGALWQFWWGGWCWGPRFLVPVLPFAIVPLGYALVRSTLARRAAWLLSVVGFAVTLSGAVTDINAILGPIASSEGSEPGIYMQVASSPIVAHVRYALAGQGIDSLTVRAITSSRPLLRLAPLVPLLGLALSLILLFGPGGVATVRKELQGSRSGGEPRVR